MLIPRHVKSIQHSNTTRWLVDQGNQPHGLNYLAVFQIVELIGKDDYHVWILLCEHLNVMLQLFEQEVSLGSP